VYAKGGPTNVDTGAAPNLGAGAEEEKKEAAPKKKKAEVVAAGAPAGSLKEVF
jgi:hypothetical protein